MSRYELIQARRPSLWDRLVRSFSLGPFSLANPPRDKALAGLWGHPSSTGISVNEQSALKYAPVFAAVNLIANDIAKLPLLLYKRLPDGRGKERYTGHPLYRLLHDSPNPQATSFVFRRTMQAQALLWGNAYAEIVRDGGGRPRELWMLHPDSVDPVVQGGVMHYRVRNERGADVMFHHMDIVHIPGLGLDEFGGMSLVEKARDSIGMGLAAEHFGASFYKHGARYGGVLAGPITEQQRQTLQASLQAERDGVDKAHRFLVVPGQMNYSQLGVKQNEAQFLESRQFQVTDIARWFNVPAHKINDLLRATFSNIEHLSIDYYTQTLVPWLETWEQELEHKLISSLEKNQQLIEHETEGLLRADSASRAALQTAHFSMGALTPNEVRLTENYNAVTGGDRAVIQQGFVFLDRLDEIIDAQIKEKTKPAEAEQKVVEQERQIAALEHEVRLADGARTDAERARQQVEEAREAAALDHRQAQQRAEDLSALSAYLDERREALEADLSHQIELLSGAETALAAEQAERAREAGEYRASLGEARADIEAARADGERLTSEVADLAAAVALRDQQVSELAEARDAIVRDLETATADHAAAVEELRELVAAAEAARGETAVALAQVEDRCREADARAQEASAALTAAQEAHRAAVEAHEQTLLELRAQVTQAEAAAQEAESHRATAEERAVEAAQRAQEAESSASAATEAHRASELALEARREAEAARMSAVIAAHRALVVDAMQRLLTKETDRARRHQTTPQKLRAWMESFYPEHVETLAESLRPVVAAQLAWMQSGEDPVEVARALAEAHCEESQAQLRSALAVEDFTPTFERMLRRWEERRPDAVADRFVTEGAAHVRNLN